MQPPGQPPPDGYQQPPPGGHQPYQPPGPYQQPPPGYGGAPPPGPPSTPQPGICPHCGAGNFQALSFTWWGGLLGPKLLSHVKCLSCKQTFNSKTGKSNNTAIAIYVGVGTVLGIFIFYWLFTSLGSSSY